MLSVSVCIFLFIVFVLGAAVLEAVQKWRAEKEARLSGDKPQQDEDEEESIYTVHNEEVNCPFTSQELPGFPGLCRALEVEKSQKCLTQL